MGKPPYQKPSIREVTGTEAALLLMAVRKQLEQVEPTPPVERKRTLHFASVPAS